MTTLSNRLKRIEDRLRIDRGARYSEAEYAAMRARLTSEEAAEYDHLASFPMADLSNDEVERGAALAEKMLGPQLRVII